MKAALGSGECLSPRLSNSDSKGPNTDGRCEARSKSPRKQTEHTEMRDAPPRPAPQRDHGPERSSGAAASSRHTQNWGRLSCWKRRRSASSASSSGSSSGAAPASRGDGREIPEFTCAWLLLPLWQKRRVPEAGAAHRPTACLSMRTTRGLRVPIQVWLIETVTSSWD